jgi:hypothetical protein
MVIFDFVKKLTIRRVMRYLFSCMDGMKESEELRDSKIMIKRMEDKPFMIEGDEFCKFEKMVLDQVAL